MIERELTEDAQIDRDEFNREHAKYGCSCCISPPCSHCIHPGNPLNQAEDDGCWVVAQTSSQPAGSPVNTNQEPK